MSGPRFLKQLRKGPVKKKAAKPASLMRAEPATDPDSNAEEA